MLLRVSASTREKMAIDKATLEDALEMERTRIMKKGEIIRSIRQSHLQRRDAEEKEKSEHVKESYDSRNRQIERTYKLAKELSRLKNLEAQELIELRSLKKEAQFSTAYTHEKARARLLEDKVRREARAIESLQNWYADESFNKMQLAKAEEKKLCYRADLQNQIIEKRRILRELDEEKQRERKIMEQMAEVVHDEDLREEMRKKETRSRLQAEKDAFFEAKKIWKEIIKRTISEENKKVGEVIAERETICKEQTEGKSDILKARELMTEKIARKMLDEEIKMKEREEICNELYLETKNIEREQEARRLLLEKQQRTKEIQDDIVKHNIAKIERKQEERAIEAEFTRDLYNEWQKLNELDKQKIQKKREKNKQYGEDLRNIINENRIEYAMKLLKRQETAKKECVERNVGRILLSW